MEIGGVGGTSAASTVVQDRQAYSANVLKKALDAESTQAKQLIEIMAQQSGVGQTLDKMA